MAFAAFAGLAYFFVCAVPLPRELGLKPVWSKELPKAAAELPRLPAFAPGALPEGSVHSFRLASSFGYFDESGGSIAVASIPFNAAVSDSGYIVYEREPASLSLKRPDSTEKARIQVAGYPFFGGGRLFVVHPGQASVSEIGPDGKEGWSHDFSAIITAFDASPSLALFGLMDGRLVGLDPSGKVMLDFAPGGSRIEGIYGCAVSPDGLMAAAICGLDRQRLVVMERRSAAYRVTWHRYLASDFRRPVSIAFTPDGRWLLYETPSGLGVYDKAGRSEAAIGAQALGPLGLHSAKRNMLLAIEGTRSDKNLLCAAPGGQRLFSLPFKGESAQATLSGDAVFLGIAAPDGAGRLIRLDFKEE